MTAVVDGNLLMKTGSVVGMVDSKVAMKACKHALSGKEVSVRYGGKRHKVRGTGIPPGGERPHGERHGG